MKLFFALGICLYQAIIGLGTRTVTCKVVDSETQNPIKNASIHLIGTKKKAITNHAGYFSIEIEDSNKEILISSIGYETLKVAIPEADRFKVMLSKSPIKLPFLNICKADDYVSKDDSVFTGGDHLDGIIAEKCSRPSQGWGEFYKKLTVLLNLDSSFRAGKTDEVVLLSFSVFSDGTLHGDLPDSNQRSLKAFDIVSKVGDWIPASQNGVLVNQHFTLRIECAEILEPVEISAEPFDGLIAFYKNLNSQLRYPETARRMGVEGRVYVEFLVNVDGSLSEFRVIKGIGGGCDEEALRVVSLSKKWKPGTQKGKPVKQRVVLPITFLLSGYTYKKRDEPTKMIDYGYRESLQLWLSNNIKYPPFATEGWLVVEFEYDLMSGRIISSNILKSLELEYEGEIIKTLLSAPGELVLRLGATGNKVLIPFNFAIDKQSNLDVSTFSKLNSSAFLAKPVYFSRFSPLGASFGETLDLFNLDHSRGRLSYSSKNLTKIPSDLYSYKDVRFLDLQDNRLEELPQSLSKLKVLKELYLSNNLLSTLPEQLKLPSIKVLGLANNKFATFPNAILEMHTIEALDLAGNSIETLPQGLSSLSGLFELYLQNNKISLVPDELFQLKNLKGLYLEGNPLSENEKERIKKNLPNTIVRF